MVTMFLSCCLSLEVMGSWIKQAVNINYLSPVIHWTSYYSSKATSIRDSRQYHISSYICFLNVNDDMFVFRIREPNCLLWMVFIESFASAWKDDYTVQGGKLWLFLNDSLHVWESLSFRQLLKGKLVISSWPNMTFAV